MRKHVFAQAVPLPLVPPARCACERYETGKVGKFAPGSPKLVLEDDKPAQYLQVDRTQM